MRDRFSAIICLILAGVFIFAGCEQKQQEEVATLDVAPDRAALSAPSDYIAEAIKAAGGIDAWSKTKELNLDCVVTFYQADGSSYLTEQRYDIYPWSNSIQISGREPQGEYSLQLSKGRFESLKGGDSIDDPSATVGKRCMADMILNILTVPARFLDQSVEFDRQSNATKLQGRWYYAIDRRSKGSIESALQSSKAIFYQDRDKAVVDMFRIVCNEGQMFLIVHGYDYTEVEKGGIVLPSRIEIFNSDAVGNMKDRLIRIDIPLQLLAYHAAIERGNDVDKPRNLAKSVTVE